MQRPQDLSLKLQIFPKIFQRHYWCRVNIPKGRKTKFTCFNDVDYDENLDIRKSISNDFLKIGIILIPYTSKIQGFENKYFTKLEYRTFMEVAKET